MRQKHVLLMLVLTIVGASLIFKNSKSPKEQTFQENEKVTPSSKVISSLIKFDEKQTSESVKQIDSERTYRKAFLGLSAIYANQAPSDFIHNSPKNLDFFLKSISSPKADERTLDIVGRILASDVEDRIKDPEAREVMIENKKLLFAKLVEVHPSQLKALKAKSFSPITNELLIDFEKNTKDI